MIDPVEDLDDKQWKRLSEELDFHIKRADIAETLLRAAYECADFDEAVAFSVYCEKLRKHAEAKSRYE